MFNEESSSIQFVESSQSSVSVPKSKPDKVYSFLVMGAATIVILAGIKAASGIVSPMLLALFMTIILVVPLRWLRNHGCPNSIALIIVLGGTVFVFSGISYFVGRSLNDFILRMPAYKNRIVQKLDQIDKQLEQYGFVLGELGRNMGKENLPEIPATESLPNNNLPNNNLSTSQIPTSPISTVPIPTAEITTNEQTKFQPEKKETTSTNKSELFPNQNNENNEDNKNNENNKNDEQVDSNNSSVEKIAEKIAEKTAEQESINETEKLVPDEIVPVSSEEIAKLLNKQDKDQPSLIALNPESVMYWVTKSLVELRRVAEGGFLVLIFTVFMVFEAARFPEKIDRAFGKEGPINNEHFHRIANDIRRYLFLKAISSLMSAVAATFVYWIFGVPATLFWGVIAFFLYFIPNIGGTLAAIIPGMLIFMTYDVQGVLLYIICLVAIECSIAYGIEPKMLGHGLGISTVVIILSLFSWGWLLGPVGLFLAAPLTIVVKIIFQAFRETAWLAILLDNYKK
ncbi:MAG: AI-2E family transporter [Planctomycetaceae bacterium]|jgi:predicted PurR-regulated permease PerM|nr:AI-2E family transporter [Planctomycetaceae bacterium]